MKFKKEIIAIILILCMLFTISAISAADGSTDAVSATNATVEAANVNVAGENNLAIENDVESLGEPDNGSFAALNTKISGASAGHTIYLENNYVYDEDNDVITTGINISTQNVIIDGQGHTIDAKGHTKFFNVKNNYLTLKNIIFKNGYSSSDAGAIYSEEDMSFMNIENCTFINNNGYYGAIYIYYASLDNIKNCTFINNTGTTSGAITWIYYGGNIDGCIFVNNTGNYAGSVYWAVYYYSAYISNSIFLNNVGNYDVYYNNQYASYNDNILELNYNWFGNTVDNNDRPRVSSTVTMDYWYVLNITTNGANNIATVSLNNLYDGTAITPCDIYALPSITFNVKGTGATVTKDAVTLDTKGDASFGFTVTESTGVLTASSNGVSISKNVEDLTDEGSISALNTKIQQAIADGESEVKLYNDYEYNDASLVKNTIYNSNNGIGMATDLTIDGQGFTIDGKNKGGRIFYFRNPEKSLTLKNINFINCKDGYGSALYVTCKNLEIINCTFVDGTATGNPGAAIYSNVYGNYLIKNSAFNNNQLTASNKNGGALVIYTNSGTTGDIVNCNFTDNKAIAYGGAIFICSNGRIGGDAGNIVGCIFKGNTANKGSSICISNDPNGVYTLSNCIILDEGNLIYCYDQNGYTLGMEIDINNNWWGSTSDDYADLNLDTTLNNNKISVNKWLYLDLAADFKNNISTISLNKLNDGNTYGDYALPKITFNVQTVNATISENIISLDENGEATIPYVLTSETGSMTVSYEDISLTKNLKLHPKDTFTSLKEQIEDAENSLILDQNYTFDSQKDSDLTNGIEINKEMTIDGAGYTIDAKSLKNIFYFNDDTKTKSLILKNIIFANATGTNGASVYFKGNKIEIINCTFINNAASSQGDAVYVADASSSENKITESRFINNPGSSSVVYVNLDSSNSKLNLNNSIFAGNDATFNVKGTSNVIVEYNWLGNTIESYNDKNVAKVDGATLNNWLFLKIDANAALKGTATVSLNNVYGGGQVNTYDDYSLPAITLNIGGIDTTAQVSSISLGANGQATYQFKMDKTNGALTANYEDITTTKELEYVCVDDGSFKALNEIIWFSSENDVIDLTKDYVYSETDTITPGIQITKTITIDGHGKTIDAKGKCGIFLINSPNVVFKNIIFKNGIFQTGGAIYASQNADYLTVNNCTFINNTATNTDGGAIWSGSYKFGSVVGSTFINNTAVEDGAAIFTYSYDTAAEIDRCVFINNSAPFSIIYAYYLFNPHDSIFLNNTANKVFTGYYSSGHNIGNNWYGNTYDNYNSAIATGSITTWLYLDIKFYEDFAIVSLNNLYTQSSSSSSVYSTYNLPEITLNIDATSMDIGGIDKVTLDSNGQAIIPYTKLSEDAKLTLSNEFVSLTKDCKVGDFDCLQYLIDSSTGNTIELTRNYTYTEGVDTITEGILISKSLTIDGKGYTIDAKGFSRIFNFKDSTYTKDLTLKNISFINGKFGYGGAVYFSGNTLEVENCNFTNNTANANPGGALYIYDNNCKFIGCSFIANSVTVGGKNGGAVYIYERAGVNNFTNCVFINNTVTQYGGAIATSQGKSILTIDKSTFINNKANYGYDIYCYGGSSAEFYLNNSLIFGTSLTGDTNNKVYVQNTLKAGDVNNNWWMHINDSNYNNQGYVRYSGGGLTVTKWLYLDMTCENEVATLSLNNLYDYSAGTSSKYDGELPQITFDLSAVNVVVDSSVALDKNGQGEVEYSLTDQTGSLTATYNSVSVTKSLTLEDSFTTLQSKINRASEGSQLTLNHDYNYDSTKDTSLVGGIVIDKDLTIDGQGYTLDAKDAARIFNINDNTKNIVLKNIKFTNARGDDGAAIYANCNNIEVINCTFEANEATNNGDALYVIANGCDISESTFVNNLGSNSVLYLSSDMQGATFNIDNSILVNNAGANIVKDANVALTADYNWWGNTVDNKGTDLSDGFAQNWYLLDMVTDDTKSIATITLNNLWDGSAYSPCDTYALPAITGDITTNAYASSRKDKVLIDKDGDTTGYVITDETNVGQITVSYNGVSITRDINYNEESDYSFNALKKLIDQYNDNGVITLTHDYEYVIGYDTITTGIDITQTNLTINGNGYTINAKEQTRIFNVGIADTTVAFDVTIKNTTFANGKMSGQGGAIRWYGWNGTLFNCTFENNSATNNGGAVYWNGQYGNVTNCTFKNNVISGYYNGGAIYINTKNVNVFNSTFIENKASNGGSISISDDNVTVINSTFIKNTASNGGAIFVGNGNKIMSNVIINNSTFTSNQANTYGGAVDLSSGNNIHIVDSTFEGNKAGSHGGAIFSNAKFNVTNSTFKGNKANSNGGVLYYDNSAGGTIYNATFIDNSANKGGVIYTYAGIVDINQTEFINNNAQGSSAYGGAIYDQSSDKLSIENSNFTGNYVKTTTSTAYGGVIYSGYGDISIVNSTFNNNSIGSTSGSTYGSVIWFGNSAKGEILNTSFLNNHGKSSLAAAMYGSGSSVEVDIINSIFLNNTYGDSNTLKVVHSYNSAAFDFTDCWFGNTVKNSGEDMGTTTGSTITYNNKLDLATVHDEYMAVGEDNQIKFVFQSRDSVIYDSSKLPKVNLTLSSVNGDLDKNSAAMDETILFNAKQFGPASITAKYNGIELTEDLYAKDKPTITVEEPIVVHVGESIGVNVIELIPSDASLSFSSIDGDEFISVANNGYVEGLKEGTSTLYIKFNGNDDYMPKTVEVPVTVIKYNTQIKVKIDSEPIDSINVDWGADPQSIVITIPTDDPNPQYDEFDLKFKINDTDVAVFTANPNIITFGTAGTANITFYFEGSDRYYGCEKNITVTVRKVVSDVTVSPVEVVYGSTNTSTLVIDGATGATATLFDGDTEITGVVSVEGNVVTVDASNLDVGTYTLSVTTNPDANHTSVTETASVVVKQASSDVVVPASGEVTYGSSVDIVVTVPDNGNASGVSAKLYLGDSEIANVVSVDALKVTVDATSLDVGTYSLNVTTVTDDNHASVTRECLITVNPAGSDVVVPSPISVVYDSSVIVTVTDLVNASGVSDAALYNGDTKVKDLAVNDGVDVVVDASGVDNGTYTLKVTTIPSDGNHASVIRDAVVLVNKASSDVVVPASGEVIYGSSVDISVIIPDNGNASGVSAKLYLGDSEVANVVSVDALKVTVDATSLDVGTYSLNVTTVTDDNHASVTRECLITVNPAGSDVVVPSPISVVYDGSVVVTVTGLVNATGVTGAALYNGDTKVKDLTVNDGVDVVVDASGVDNGTYTLKVTTVPVDANHASVIREGVVLVNKAGSDVVVPVSGEVTYGSTVDITVTLPENANASSITAKIYSGMTEIENALTVNALKVTVDASKLAVGTYSLNVTTVTDSNHAPVTRQCIITVNPAGSEVIVPASTDVNYTESADIIVTIPENGNASAITAKLYLGDNEIANVLSVDALKITVDASNLDVGTYTLKVTTVPSDTNHTFATREASVSVIKINSTVTFLPSEILFAYEDEGSTIAECIGCTIDVENVTVIGHPEAVIKVEGNKITVSNLIEDEYMMKVITTPDKNHLSIEKTVKVTVKGISPKMSMEVSNITFGEKETVFITMDTVATGIVNITIFEGNEIVQSKNITINNRFNKTVFENLKVGTYTITAHYYGTQNYNEATIPDTFTVHPVYNLEFSANVNDTICGSKTNATVTLSPDASGSIQIGNIIKSIEGPVTVIELPVQNIAGKNNVSVKYIPDKNSKYGESEIVVYYNVAKKQTEITIADITGKKVDDDVEITASAYYGAVLNIYVDGVKLDSNKLEDVTAGTHTVVVNVAETSQYLAGSANITFTVLKHDVSVSVEGTPVFVGEKSTVSVSCNVSEGIVVVNVNGSEYSVDLANGNSFEIAMPNVGVATVTARYVENNKYNAKAADAASIVVTNKSASDIVVQIPDNIKVGDVVIINVTTSNPQLEVTVDGEKQTVADGKITFTASKAGIYNIIAKTNETSEIFGEVKFASFEVTKKSAEIIIADISGKKVGDDVVIDAASYAGADIVLYVDGVKLDSNTIENITAGSHTVIATVAETDEYLQASVNKTFTVAKHDVSVSVEGTPVFVGEKSTVSVSCNVSEGIVVVNVNGSEYSIDLANGNSFDVAMPNVGVVPVTARYVENNKYNAKVADGATIEVTNKSASDIVVQIPDAIKVGDVVVINVTTSNPELEVTVDGEKQTVADGKITFTASKAGIYNIIAKTNETSEIFGEVKFASFEVTKKSAEIIIADISGKKVGDDVVIDAASYAGADIILYVDGVKLDSNTIVNIAAGSHTVIATVAETDEYLQATANRTFIVAKHDVILSVKGNDTKVGEISTITLTCDADYGTVILNINDAQYSINVSDKNTLDVVMPKVGIITFTAKFLENNKYNAKDAQGSVIVSNKAESNIVIEIPGNIKVGQSVEINVTTRNAELEVTVNGDPYTVSDGKITFTPVEAGIYNIVARANQTSEYFSDYKFASFEVTKKAAGVVISDITPKMVGDDIVVEVSSYDGADIVVYVDGAKQTLTDNKFTIKAIAGNHTIIASVAETNEYLAGSANKSFSVSKYDVDLNVIATPVFVGEKSVITVTCTASEGIVVVSVNGSEYSLDLANGNTFEVVMPNVGVASLTARYIENDMYNAKVAEAKTIEVANKTLSDIAIQIPDNIKVGDEITINVTTSNVELEVTINGKKQTVNEGKITFKATEAGIYNIIAKTNETSEIFGEVKFASFEVTKKSADVVIADISPKMVGDDVEIAVSAYDGAAVSVYVDGEKQTLADNKVIIKATAGIHTIIASVDETDEYLSAMTNTTFGVSKYDVDLNVSATPVFVGEKSTVTVKSSVSEGIVVINVNGSEYSLNLSNHHTIDVLMPNVGVASLTARYIENDRYNAKVAEAKTIEVANKTLSDIAIQIPDNIKVGDEITINVTTSNVELEVTINGKKQTVNEGKITFKATEAGIYNIIAKTNETSEIFGEVKFASFEVTKKAVEITIADIAPAKVDDNVEIIISAYEGADIIIYVDGVKLDSNVIEKVTAGTHTVIASVAETDEYLSAMANKTFTVSKYDVDLNVSATPVFVGEKSTITVKSNVSEGVVLISINGTEYSLNLANGNTLEVVMNSPGSIPLTAKYVANDKYNAKDAQKSAIEVTLKETPVIFIDVASVAIVGDEMTINVTTSGYNLTVKVIFNDEVIKTENGSFTFTPQKDGIYTIIAKTTENDTFYGVGNTTSFAAINRTKETPNIIISKISNAKVGEEITFTVSAVAGGEATVKINDEIITPKDGVYTYTPKKGGLTVLTVETPENERYTKGFNITTFDVVKKQSEISITVEGDLIVDKNIALNIKSYEGANIVVYLDGKVLDDWETPFKTTAGDHLIIATVEDNDEYLGSSANKTFVISKKQSDIYVSGSHAFIGEKSIVEVDLTKGAGGMVIVNVDGTEYSLNITKNNTLTVVLDKAGLHNISARYLGDDKYLPSESEVNTIFVEDKMVSSIEVDVPAEITAGSTVVIDIYSNNDNLEALFDGVKKEIIDGKLTLANIAAGSHNVEVIAKETSTLKANSTVKSFTVAKKEAKISIVLPENIVLGQDIEINVSSYDGAEIEVFIDGIKQSVKDGKITIRATVGSHTVIASVAENTQYLQAMANKTFAVDKFDTEISISGLNITEGGKTTITIETPLNEGVVNVKVDGNEVLVDLSKGKSCEIQLNVPGDYEVSASYLGSDYYKAAEAKTTINVAKKLTPSVDIANEGDASQSEIGITLPSDATGTLTVTVDGNNTYSADVVNGSASVTINDLDAGAHDIAVNYSGDAKYESISKNTTVDVAKVAIPENATEVNMTIPEATTSPVFNITLPGDASGTVTVTVDGNNTYNASVVNGTACVVLPELSVGNHSISVDYSGDDKYMPVSKNVTADVPKAEIPENLTEVDITIPEGTTSPVFDITLPGDANGTLTVVVDENETYTVDVVNGTANVDLGQLDVGNHNITVTYSGNEKYASKSIKFDLNVPKAEIPENATEVNMTIPEGTTSPIVNITLPGDANGTVTVTVDGDKNYTADVVNGEVSLNIPDLSAGKHDIVVSYSGDEKYAPATKKSSIDVPKVDVANEDVKINVELPIASKSPTVDITLPSDATGYVVVNNSGVCLYSPIKNAKASINLGDLPYGENYVIVIYSGDDKYNPVAKDCTIHVPEPVLTAKDVVYGYSNVAKYKTLVTVDGKAVAGENVTFIFNGKTYTSVSDENGYATLKVYTSKVKVGNYKITSKFNDVSVTKKFKINNIIVAKNMNAKKSKAFKIKVSLKKVANKYLKGKTIKLRFNGKNYKAKTNSKGVAVFKFNNKALSKHKVGKKYKYRVTYGKDVVTKQIKIRR